MQGHPLVPNPNRAGERFCPKCKSVRTIAWQKANPDKARAAQARYREANRDELLAARRAAYARDRDKLKTQRTILRREVLEAYGTVCQCCGEDRDEFLAIDHINGDGAEHRKQVREPMYAWLKRNGYPSGFRVLCHNCNMARGLYGCCPHELEQEDQQPKGMIA
jgi:hypothetical protein